MNVLIMKTAIKKSDIIIDYLKLCMDEATVNGIKIFEEKDFITFMHITKREMGESKRDKAKEFISKLEQFLPEKIKEINVKFKEFEGNETGIITIQIGMKEWKHENFKGTVFAKTKEEAEEMMHNEIYSEDIEEV